MKKQKKYYLLVAVMLLVAVLGLNNKSSAQVYNNEWIDYTKTYYKFKIAQTGIYRINIATLASAGINTIPARQFQLWHQGHEIPLYIPSDSNTAVNGTSYIEFFGEKNDGIADSDLYRVKDYQLCKYWSLETDSAAYYLTIHPQGGNARVQTVKNETANVATGQSPDAYFMYQDASYPKETLNWGRASTGYGGASSYIYSSAYDLGEGWTSGEIGTNGTGRNILFNNLKIYTSGPAAQVRTAVFGVSGIGANRTITLSLNGQQLDQRRVDSMRAGTLSGSDINPAAIGTSATFNLSGVNVPASTSGDRFVYAYLEFLYPRLFDFTNNNGNAGTQFIFDIQPKATGNYLEIKGFNSGNTQAVLYDVNSGERYESSETSGTFRFYLNPTTIARHLILYSQMAGVVQVLPNTALERKTFVDYRAVNQGDYLIITNKILHQNSDAMEQYRAYRSSEAGGGYNAKVYDIDQLEDQFAFGIKRHPNSIRTFLKYATETFASRPKYILLMGRGMTYNRYYQPSNSASSSDVDQVNLVPTFGYPASDILLASSDLWPVASIPIGRVAVLNPQQITDYLNKVKEYEAINSGTTIADKLWMKNTVNIAGGFDEAQSNLFIYYLDQYENYLSKPYYGAINYDFNKYSSSSTSELTDTRLSRLFAEGIGFINYFGHASATSLDFNLSDPSAYNNQGKYPVFFTSGCDIGDYFDYTRDQKIPEKYVLAPNRGAIAFIAQSYLGLTSFLHNYNVAFFQHLATDGYNQSIAYSQIAAASATIRNNYPYLKDSIATEAEAAQNILLGDPAIKVHNFEKPDYAIESSSILVSPNFISVTNASYSVKAYISNLGRAVDDSVTVRVQRISPNGTNEIIYDNRIGPVYSKDSISFDVPIVGSRDKGQCYLVFTIDPDNKIDEVTKVNNTYRKSVFIYESGITPVYPYNYSIVKNAQVKLTASTATPIAPEATYIMQMDTTMFFNSGLRVTKTVRSVGGVITFDPAVSFRNNYVYYWRVAVIPGTGQDTVWSSSSFMYLSTATEGGYNQSHLYQHLESTFDQMSLDSTSRNWNFTVTKEPLEVIHSIFPNNLSAFRVLLNNNEISEYWCGYYKIVFNVFEYSTLLPYYNSANPTTTPIPNGTDNVFAGSNPTSKDKCIYVFYSGGNVATNFEFDAGNTAGRNAALNFMNWIPNKSAVVVRLFYDNQQGFSGTGQDPATWVGDRQANGNNNTLYDGLKNAGFSNIDEFTPALQKAFVFVYNKNFVNPLFPPEVKYTTTSMSMETVLPVQGTEGKITSPRFGPAAKWHTVLWDGASTKNANGVQEPAGDQFSVDVLGVDNVGSETLLHTMGVNEKSWDASNVSVQNYPYLKLRMHNSDTVNFTPFQMNYWRILYDAVPEGALAANLYYHSSKDTLNRGESYKMGIGFKNIGEVPFKTNIKVKYSIFDKNNIEHIIPVDNLKALAPGEVGNIEVSVPGVQNQSASDASTLQLGGSNNQYISVNPDYDQPEQTLINNFMYKELYVIEDANSQNLDVTFDGLHILNNDIISPTPHIVMRFRDESKFLLLKDTGAIVVMLQYPDGTLKRINYVTGDSLVFTPAKDSANNTAMTDFNPLFTQDGTYRLLVYGQNPLDPEQKPVLYAVAFQIQTKPMISDVFNYPNPFTTSTAFVFTLTGTHIPQNIRIQIMTITGKIVKEITKDELGTLTLGRNITEYKWDGRDQYGQKLANGVYLYRVLTNEEGKSLDKYQITDKGKAVDTGKYFKGGYGKMYLMR